MWECGGVFLRAGMIVVVVVVVAAVVLKMARLTLIISCEHRACLFFRFLFFSGLKGWMFAPVAREVVDGSRARALRSAYVLCKFKSMQIISGIQYFWEFTNYHIILYYSYTPEYLKITKYCQC